MRPASEYVYHQKNCRTGEIRSGNLGELLHEIPLERRQALEIVNRWNMLSAIDTKDSCLWLYWLEGM